MTKRPLKPEITNLPIDCSSKPLDLEFANSKPSTTVSAFRRKASEQLRLDLTGVKDESIPAKPVISNLSIDCSGKNTLCVSEPVLFPGKGTPGEVSPVDLESHLGYSIGNAGVVYATGQPSEYEIRVSVNCDGDGGATLDDEDIEIQ